MNFTEITEIDGKQLYHSFLSGAHKIFEHQRFINKINVFPVADADTGTNLASTMRSIIDIATPNINMKLSAISIADAALTGARGNSGIIFAQFLYGFSNELKAKETITVEDFAVSMQRAVKYAYEAIADPREGTMISVIKDWAEHLDKIKDHIHDFIKLLIDALVRASESLKATTEQMEVLRKANVVDAGAKGFVVFLEGMLEFFKTGQRVSEEILANDTVVEEEVISHEEITFRYCTEALITGDNLDKEAIRDVIRNEGDSMVVAGSPQKIRIHIHTDRPWDLFVRLGKLGNIASQKVEDMIMQNEVASSAKYKIALVTDSTCDLPQEIIEAYQIQVIPVSIHFGNTFYLDKLTMQPEQFYKMLEESSIYPSTSQPAYKEFFNSYNFLSTHYESIISLHLSKNLSGTWQNSNNAGNKISAQTGRKIDVVNSNRTSNGLGLLVLRAAKALEAGMTHDEIVASIPQWSANSRIFVSAKTLKYIIKSGRVGKVVGAVGSLLGLKPILEVDNEGRIIPFGKPLSIKQSRRMIIKEIIRYTEGKKVWGYAISHARNEQGAQWFANELETHTGKKAAFIQHASPALVANVGTGVVAVGIILE